MENSIEFINNEKLGLRNKNKEYILCSAIKRIKERECPKTYKKSLHDIYKIELGYRHCDIIHRFGDEVSLKSIDQGFYTSFGRFVDRTEAMKIAKKYGQVENNNNSKLFSEDLY